MGILHKLKRSWIERKFKKNNLGIIQSVSKDTFHGIIDVLHSRGWEVSFDYFGPDGWSDKGSCKVRKGVSVLDFSWSSDSKGSITGMNRIVAGLANEFELVKRDQPF